MRDQDYPQHPEEYMPAWMLELKDCPTCMDVLPSSIPSHVEWLGDVCTCRVHCFWIQGEEE